MSEYPDFTPDYGAGQKPKRTKRGRPKKRVRKYNSGSSAKHTNKHSPDFVGFSLSPMAGFKRGGKV